MLNTLLISYRSYLVVFSLLLLSTVSMAQIEEADNSNSRFYYSGNLGLNNPIELNMQVTGYAVSGSYMFISSGDIFVFKGRLSADKTGMGVLVYNSEDSYIASIEADIISEDVNFAHEIKGRWKPIDGGNSKNLLLTKVAEFASTQRSTKSSYSR